MARIRSVHPGFLTDENLLGCSAFARLLYIGILIESDDQGIFEWKPVTLKIKTLPVDNVQVVELLAELTAARAIKRFHAEGRDYGVVRNFRKFQRPKYPNSTHPTPPDWRNYVGLDKAIGGIGVDEEAAVPPNAEMKPDDTSPFPEKGGKSPQMEDGGCRMDEKTRKKEPVIRTVGSPTRPDLDQKFQEFREAYPNRKGGNPWKPARTVFDAAVKRGTDPAKIIGAIRAKVGFDPDKIGTEYIPQAQKWLRDQRFDEWTAKQPEPDRPAYMKAPPGMQSYEEIMEIARKINATAKTPEVRSNASMGSNGADHGEKLRVSGGKSLFDEEFGTGWDAPDDHPCEPGN